MFFHEMLLDSITRYFQEKPLFTYSKIDNFHPTIYPPV